ARSAGEAAVGAAAAPDGATTANPATSTADMPRTQRRRPPRCDMSPPQSGDACSDAATESYVCHSIRSRLHGTNGWQVKNLRVKDVDPGAGTSSAPDARQPTVKRTGRAARRQPDESRDRRYTQSGGARRRSRHTVTEGISAVQVAAPRCPAHSSAPRCPGRTRRARVPTRYAGTHHCNGAVGRSPQRDVDEVTHHDRA